MHLLDSSAIISILLKHHSQAPNLLMDEATIDLARYELGNTLWKEHTLLKKSTPEQLSRRVNEVAQILSLMNVICLDTDRIAETLDVAVRCRLSFYDAAYLDTAIIGGCTLVTEDERLMEAAQKLGHRASYVNDIAPRTDSTRP